MRLIEPQSPDQLISALMLMNQEWVSFDIETNGIHTSDYGAKLAALKQRLTSLEAEYTFMKAQKCDGRTCVKHEIVTTQRELRSVSMLAKKDKSAVRFYENTIELMQFYDGEVAIVAPRRAFDGAEQALNTFFNSKKTVYIHNASFELTNLLYHYDIVIDQGIIWDTQIVECVTSCGEWPSGKEETGDTAGKRLTYVSLKAVIERRLGITLDKTFQVGTDWSASLSKGMLEYALDDVLYLKDIANSQRLDIEAYKLEGAVNLELRTLAPVSELLVGGIHLDRALLRKWESVLLPAIEKAVKRFSTYFGLEVDDPRAILNSPTKLLKLFHTFGIFLQSVGSETLKALAVIRKNTTEYAVDGIQAILDYRRYVKVYGTYVRPYLESGIVTKNNNLLIYPNYKQCLTDTGRFSSNFQQVPSRGLTIDGVTINLRAAFIPRKGAKLVGADLSQIEIRLLASMAGEPNLVDALAEGRDIHKTTAALMFNVRYDDVSKEQRTKAKSINFGLVYGQTPRGLALQLDVPVYEASKLHAKYLETMPKVKEFITNCHNVARTTGETRTVLGRRRVLQNINSSVKYLREASQNAAQNTPIQGTSADGVKEGLCILYAKLKAKGWLGKVRFLIQLHDEVVLEVDDVVPVEEVQVMLADSLIEGSQKFCPLVDIKVGNVDNGFTASVLARWSDLK